MHIRGIHQDSLAAQAQYAEWRRRLQDTEEPRAPVRPDEAEEDEEAQEHQEQPEEELQDEGNPAASEGESAPGADEDEDDGQPHLRSFA